ncbi:MAG: tetratricopeptide repeat protein [Deltaproteobacteria bacterium]|nr:tetratricopeptide repeat protein [Deltaproteobacteria bacterium]
MEQGEARAGLRFGGVRVGQREGRRVCPAWGDSFWCRLLLVALASFAVGCASFPGVGQREQGRSAALVRPELPVDYDVLVGEMALQDGDYEGARDAIERAIAKDPNSAYLERRLARFLSQLEDLDGAIAHVERAVELEPDDEESRLFLGHLYRLQRDVEAVREVLTDETGQPISERAALVLYQAFLEADRLDEALVVGEDLVARDPEALGGHMAVATIYERMGRTEDAALVLRKALVLHPGRFVLYSRLARLERASGDREGEVAIYREALEQHPHHYGVLVSLGEALIATDDLEGAIDVYADLVEHYPDDVKSVRRFASLEYAAGRREQAAIVLENAFARFPEHYELAYSLGQVRRGAGDDDGALEAFLVVPPEQAVYLESRTQVVAILESRKDYTGALREIETLRRLRPNRALEFHAASLYQRSGDLEAGVAILDAMLEENPRDDEAFYQLGVLYGMEKNSDKAIEYMNRALEINPNNAHALNYVGYSWAERGKNLDQAEEYIQRALAQRPNDGFIADSLGWVYYQRGRPLLGTHRSKEGVALLQQARDQLILAAELTGGDPVVSEHLGDVYFLLEDKERAYYFYEEAVRLEHREDEQPELLDKLEGLKRELGEP